MKKIVKMLRTVEVTSGDNLIGDVTYPLDAAVADPLLKDGWAELVSVIDDPVPPPKEQKADTAPPARKAKPAVVKRSPEYKRTLKASRK